MSIEIKNLSKKFNEVYAVKNINFTIGTNKTIGLLGPNGCGKTTSIGMMLGLIKPTTGDIIIQDKNINNFVDAVHLTNNGSKIVSDIVSESLINLVK